MCVQVLELIDFGGKGWRGRLNIVRPKQQVIFHENMRPPEFHIVPFDTHCWFMANKATDWLVKEQ